MIKQDYLLRMIQEIITLIINMLLNKQKVRPQQWVEYDTLTRQILGVSSEKLSELSPEEIMEQYKDDENRMGKIELAAMTILKIADETGDEHLMLKSRLRQNGLFLLEYIQNNGNTFSLQRVALINMLKTDFS